MPKPKGAGSSTPTMNLGNKKEDVTLDAANDVGELAGVFTRSRSRRLSITLPDHISPPKKARRSSISKKAPAAETPTSNCLLNESMHQVMKEKPTSSVSKIADELKNKSNNEGIAKVTPSPKTKKLEKKGISLSPAEKLKELEDQELSCSKMESNFAIFSKKNMQDSVVVGSPHTKREKTRKSVNLGKILEDKVLEDMEEEITSSVEPKKMNGTGSIDNCQEIEKISATFKKEKPRKSLDNLRCELTPKSTPNEQESLSLVKLQKVPQPDSKKSVTPVRSSNKKAVVEGGSTAPKKLEPTTFEQLDKTPHPISKKTISAVKLSNRKFAIEDGSPLNKMKPISLEKRDKTPQPVSKKPDSTPKKLEPMSLEKLNKTPQPVSKKPATPVKVSNKKAIVEDDTDSDEDSDAESRKEIMRSAEKRIIRNLSTSESESRNHVKVLQLPVVGTNEAQQMKSSTDSDSAPEDVTFDASRQSALELLKRTVDSIKRDKQKKKEKRKERLEILRQRKEENLIRFKESKANRDDASCSSSEESLHDKNGQIKIGGASQAKKTLIAGQANPFGLKRLSTTFLDELPDKVPSAAPGPKKTKISSVTTKQRTNQVVVRKKYRAKKMEFSSNGGATRFDVVPLNAVYKLKSTSKKANQVAQFKSNLLFGNNICRVPGSTHANNRKKLLANKK